ncbi:hypothetical protein ACO229_18665 [Promicromonospora sp. MS192]|uniref:hypothetical protein n=1 Tax=Promicromonospora sp. MS192 TaxID=3412684 RepID=UPI003C2E9FF4
MIGKQAETSPDRPQALGPVTFRESQLCLRGVVLDPHRQRGAGERARQLRERVTGSVKVVGEQLPLRRDQPRRMAWMLTENRAGGITLARGGERLGCPPTDGCRAGYLLTTPRRGKCCFKLENASQDGPLLVSGRREVLSRPFGVHSRLVEPQEREQAPSPDILSNGPVGPESGLGQLRDRLFQQRLGLVEKTYPVEHLGPSLQRDTVVLVRGEVARGCHLRERRRSVAEHAQVVPRVVAGERDEHPFVRFLGVMHGREVVSHGPLDVTEVRQGKGPVQIGHGEIAGLTGVAHSENTVEEPHRFCGLPRT